MLHLVRSTDPRYAEVALAALDHVLVDHAHCEHKAAVTALSFVSKYPDDPRLVVALSALARDEAGHFARIARVCTERGLSLGYPDRDPYVVELMKAVRRPHLEHRVDRLLVAAIIEGRSCERLRILAHALAEKGDPLARLYDDLWREEAAHHTLFIELAERSLVRAGVGRASHVDQRQAAAIVAHRLRELCEFEADVVDKLPLRPAIH